MISDSNRLRCVGVGCAVPARGRRAVTMVEILVVTVIILILLGAVITASGVLIGKAKETNTEAVLRVVNEALVEFEREQKSKPTLTRGLLEDKAGRRKLLYSKRYGLFPPDELEVFVDGGNLAPRSLAPSRGQVVPGPGVAAMKFYSDPTNPAHDPNEHRDLAAMIVGIELLGDSSKAILDRIEGKNRSAGVVDASGEPLQFVDNNGDGNWSGGDHQIRYILDDWGNPLSYFAQRDWKSNPNKPSSNHTDWNRASTKFIQLNRGRPIIMSYGADGAEQLTKDAMKPDAAASLVGDFSKDNIVDNPFNADNVFLNSELKEKLLQGVE